MVNFLLWQKVFIKFEKLKRDVAKNVVSQFKNVVILSPFRGVRTPKSILLNYTRLARKHFCLLLHLTDSNARLGRDVVSNAVRLNNSFVKMQIRASKACRKHFYSLLHLTDSNARLGRDVVILSLARKGNGVRIP